MKTSYSSRKALTFVATLALLTVAAGCEQGDAVTGENGEELDPEVESVATTSDAITAPTCPSGYTRDSWCSGRYAGVGCVNRYGNITRASFQYCGGGTHCTVTSSTSATCRYN